MNISGLWKLAGHQNLFPNVRWEADLLLNQNGTLTWTETKGANVGAFRKGNWTLSGDKFYFQYSAPSVGMVTWNGRINTTGTSVDGTYNAGNNNAYGGIWGGHYF